MYYLEVAVASAHYHGYEPLTYSSSEPLPAGSIVIAPLRSQRVLGVVLGKALKPHFAVKEVLHVPTLPPLPRQLIKLMVWMQTYYPSPYGIITQQFLPKSLPTKPIKDLFGIGQSAQRAELPPLTVEQTDVLSQVAAPGTYLLHGDTGSGKTRVYIELAKQVVTQGKSAIILTPEIGLTSQLAADFRLVFGEQVIVLHSQLTDLTRRSLWEAILSATKPIIAIGPRSALFSPLSKVGLIVLDEVHEPAYKQDQAPYYHATRVASSLAILHKAVLVLGSATPPIADYFLAEAKNRPILRMRQTANAQSAAQKDITVVDLKDRSQFSRSPYLSDNLISVMKKALAANEQVLLFLNRRGTARIVFCEKCGWQAICPHCDLPLIYHGDSHLMRCHTCDFKSPGPSDCPQCHNTSVVLRSIGTKAVVDEAQRIFPGAQIMRFDTDNKKSERIEQNYESIRSGKIDIIVGTQTLAKGLDLPHLAVVGVIAADTSLSFPDFSAQERTYQLISQVIGRVGRGHRSGKVILQTYVPDSPLLKTILANDWTGFYNAELHERSRFNFPPYCYLLKLSCRRASIRSAETTANKFAEELRHSGLRLSIDGPAPAFHEKSQNRYQWQIVAKAKSRDQLLRVIKMLPAGWSYDIDPLNLL